MSVVTLASISVMASCSKRVSAAAFASAVRWLAGPQGRYVTGQAIHVNGGLYLGA